MIAAIARTEFSYQFRALQALVTFGVLFGLTFLLTANAGEFETFAPGGRVLANAPYAITETLIKLSVFSIFVVPAFIATAVLRDVEHGFHPIFFALPISEGSYLAGRFAGAFGALMVALAGAPLGLLLGTFWPWADAELLGPTHLGHYAQVFIGIVLPTMFALSAIVFAVAVLTRSLLATYLCTMALLAIYLVTGSFEAFPPLLDPFLFEVFDAETRYWTAAERNAQLLAFEGPVLHSRTLWVVIALASLVIANHRFSFRTASVRSAPRTAAAEAAKRPVDLELGGRATPTWDRWTTFRQYRGRTLWEARGVVATVPFLILMALNFFVLFLQLSDREILYGVDALPLTYLMLADGFPTPLTILVVIVFYSADILWRERACGIHELLDATPVSNGVLVGAKLSALLLIVVSILGLGVLLGISLQLVTGYPSIDVGLYLERGLLYPFLPFVCLAVLTCFFQVIARNRFLGMMLFAVFLGAVISSRDLLGVEHPLASYVYPAVGAPLADMNGTGGLATFGYWLRAYWGAIAGLLLIVTFLLYPRGTDQPLRFRLRRLSSVRTPRVFVPAAACLLVGVGSGAVIYYNTNVLNSYVTQAGLESLQVDYERAFGQYEGIAMPRIVEIRMAVDLFPVEGRIEARSTHLLENRTNESLDEVHVVFPPALDVRSVTLEGAGKPMLNEALVPYYRFPLLDPMQPGERRALDFDVHLHRRGFAHGRPETRLVQNGTFVTNEQLAPSIGFNPNYVVEDPRDRKRLGLAPRPGRKALEDQTEYGNNVTRSDSGFVHFEATLSTVRGQTAVTLGALQEQWDDGERSFFRYRLDAPTRNFFPVMSAAYAVTRDRWEDVAIEVFHHPSHDSNVPRMTEAMKDSLAFYTDAFGPYPFSHLRIAEFPGYRSYAQAFAGTVPFAESLGFLADVRATDIDMPYYVTAHEVAHMWWGHVVTAANVQGDNLIHESLAQYSALRLMEQRQGSDGLRRFLKYELDRYLAGRADDPSGELALYRVERQSYVYYRKGSVVMMALADYLGADVVDEALRRFVELRGFSEAPYATTTDLLDSLKDTAGREHHGLIEDLFERITLFDLAVSGSEVTERADGRFEVRLDITAGKTYAEPDGTESAATMDLPVDIGIFARSPDDPDFGPDDVIHLEKTAIANGASTVVVAVDRRPAVVGIDPYHKLIDRDSGDNLALVQ